MTFDLPVDYTKLTKRERDHVREQYVREQDGKCMWCDAPLDQPPPTRITDKPIKWEWFPGGERGFLRNPVHLQHCHTTGKTEGAVHGYCNAVMWQYHCR